MIVYKYCMSVVDTLTGSTYGLIFKATNSKSPPFSTGKNTFQNDDRTQFEFVKSRKALANRKSGRWGLILLAFKNQLVKYYNILNTES